MSRRKKRGAQVKTPTCAELQRRMKHAEERAAILRGCMEDLARRVKRSQDPMEHEWLEGMHIGLGDSLDRYEEEIAELYAQLEGRA